MKILTVNGNRIRFDRNDYQSYQFIQDIYKEYMKPIKELINLVVDNPDNLSINVALRLKKGEKLEICSYYKISKLNIKDAHDFSQSKNKKYIKVYIDRYFDDCVFISVDDFLIRPNFETWYLESKLLNEENFKTIANDYIDELKQQLSKIESMISYTKYNNPGYYNYDNPGYYDVDGKPVKYIERLIDGKIMNVSEQCIKYINDNNFTEAEANDIIYDDINNHFYDPQQEVINKYYMI